MYLSYSGFSIQDKCPLAYYHMYVVKTRRPQPDNRVNMLYGSIVGEIFARFYNGRMWRAPNFVADLMALVPIVAQEIIAEEAMEWKQGIFNWRDPKANYRSLEEVLRDVEETIPRAIKAIKHHRLVGKRADAEVQLDTNLNGHVLAGRSDFVIGRVPPHEDLIILDGKGSRHRDTYVDFRQLLWYAMLYKERHKALPDKLGFLYWRSDAETSIDWKEFKPEDIDELRQGVLETIASLESRVFRLPQAKNVTDLFPAQPSRDCKWCAYLPICPSGTSFMANKGKAPQESSSETVDASGVEDVSL